MHTLLNIAQPKETGGMQSTNDNTFPLTETDPASGKKGRCLHPADGYWMSLFRCQNPSVQLQTDPFLES